MTQTFGNWPNTYQVNTFGDAQTWAQRNAGAYTQLKINEDVKGDATYWLCDQIYPFAVAMYREDKIEQIHKSCISRLQHVHWQNRSIFAVILLLLSLEDKDHFNRYKRNRIANTLCAALENKITPTNLRHWIRTNGGFERFRKPKKAFV